MKNLEARKERFLKDPINVRIGNLASDLARLSSFSENVKNRKAVEDILEESKFFIEWSAQEAPFEIQILFSEMQSRLALWHLHLGCKKETAGEIKELRNMTRDWSSGLLKACGFIE